MRTPGVLDFFRYKSVEILLFLKVLGHLAVKSDDGLLQIGTLPYLVDVFLDGWVGGRVEKMIVDGDPEHPAHPEIPIVIAQVTPGDQVPGIPIMQQADGLDLSQRDLFLIVGTILQVDNLFARNRLL